MLKIDLLGGSPSQEMIDADILVGTRIKRLCSVAYCAGPSVIGFNIVHGFNNQNLAALVYFLVFVLLLSGGIIGLVGAVFLLRVLRSVPLLD